MPYNLRRTRDGAGDTGQMSEALRLVDGQIEDGGSRPRVGYVMRVGTFGSRTYASQDYWTTTYVTEILEESEGYVRFKTGNSEYEWESF